MATKPTMSNTPSNGTTNGKTPRRAFCGVKGRSGPPTGNANAQRHGMRGGKLPKGCAYIENRCNALRRQVEAAIVAMKGEINIVDAAAINSILKWERHGLLAAHWLRHEADKLTATERLKFSEAIARASDNRDRNIRALGLDVKPDPWDSLGLPAPHDDRTPGDEAGEPDEVEAEISEPAPE
jgi:hypothetical protein